MGDIVFIGNASSKGWTFSKSLEVIPRWDGVARLVKLKTAVGEFIKPINYKTGPFIKKKHTN